MQVEQALLDPWSLRIWAGGAALCLLADFSPSPPSFPDMVAMETGVP